MRLAGRAPTGEALNIATGTNRMVFGLMPSGAAADRGREEERMADVEEEEATEEAREVTMTETQTEILTTTVTATESETEVGVLATYDYSDPAQLHKVIRVDHCGTGNGSQTHAGCRVLARAT